MQSCKQPEGLTLFNEAIACLERGELNQAKGYLQQSLQQLPGVAEIHANLALVFEQLGEPHAAERSYRRALVLDPRFASAHLNYGALLADQRRFAEARHHYERSLALRPESARAWSNMGVLLSCMRLDADAEACFSRALKLDPHYALARYNYSYLLLRQGRYAEGWGYFESRNWYAQLADWLPFPRWQGESLADKSLLLGCEAGQGDMIQFCRYASLLRARGVARIGLLCHPGLVRLLASLPGLDEVIGVDQPLPSSGWDAWVPLMSLPGLCGSRLDTLPAPIPYLYADPAAQAGWAARLPQDGLRVGVVWRGNPRFENDAERSLPALAVLAPLWRVPGVHFISLQKGPGEVEANPPPAGQPLLHLGPDLQDFADTAAVIANLDLVISVDTAVAHLAGALGVPCWLMLPEYKTDWRWLDGRVDSPWYPGVMRLFRQTRAGEWGEVVDALQASLAVLARMHQP
ncbi:tetratricopeptide repeat protein [Chitinimonas naiadis]